MPLTSPAFPPGPYRFVDREFFIVTYRTDPDALRAVIRAPLEMADRLSSSSSSACPTRPGSGITRKVARVIPVSLQGERGGYVHSMYLNDNAPIAAGRELWGFPKKLAFPELRVEKDTLGGDGATARSRSRLRPWATSTLRSTMRRSSSRCGNPASC